MVGPVEIGDHPIDRGAVRKPEGPDDLWRVDAAGEFGGRSSVDSWP